MNADVLSDVLNSVIKREAQIMLVKAPFGFGKSALRDAIRSFLTNSNEIDVKPIMVQQPEFSELQFYKDVGTALGIEFGKYWRDKFEVRRLLKDKLLKEDHGAHKLLIVDDAQFLHPDALFAVKYITDLERKGQKICTALLLGSPEIDRLLEKPTIAQVVDRMHLRRDLRPFSQRDTFEYVARAMSYAKLEPVAGDYEFPTSAEAALAEAYRLEPFNPEAVAKAFDLTNGVPRYLRLLCAQALLIRAREAEGISERDRFRVLASVMERAWETLLARQEAGVSLI